MDSSWPASQIDPPIKQLTRDEAKALSARQPAFKPFALLIAQAVFGVLVALVWWAFSGSQMAGLSALYGALSVLLPNALMARGVFGGRVGASVAGFVLWELVKLVAVGSMMAVAPFLIKPLSWPAMLANMLLCMKFVGVALIWQGRTKKM
jgi:ATP synthase protein I